MIRHLPKPLRPVALNVMRRPRLTMEAVCPFLGLAGKLPRLLRLPRLERLFRGFRFFLLLFFLISTQRKNHLYFRLRFFRRFFLGCFSQAFEICTIPTFFRRLPAIFMAPVSVLDPPSKTARFPDLPITRYLYGFLIRFNT